MEINALNDLLSQLRAASGLAKGSAAGSAGGPAAMAGGAAKVDFGAALKGALDNVNEVQAKATTLARDYELGVSNVGMHDVAIALQKSSIAFQGAVQVRNKLVAAYHDMMNMQI